MGFIHPDRHKHAYFVSPLGRRLVDATRDVQIQQILRYAVASYRSGLSYSGDLVHLHPLSWTLSVLRALSRGRTDSRATRGFKVDEELRPIGFAAGGRADLVFEFESFILVIETTLMAGSRQEAAEGEPVRRHVADGVARCEKPVRCIFVAARLDLNTIETFRIGKWYNAREELLDLEIVPVTVRQFREWLLRVAESAGTEDAYRALVSLARSKPSVEEDAIAWRDDLNKLLPVG